MIDVSMLSRIYSSKEKKAFCLMCAQLEKIPCYIFAAQVKGAGSLNRRFSLQTRLQTENVFRVDVSIQACRHDS